MITVKRKVAIGCGGRGKVALKLASAPPPAPPSAPGRVPRVARLLALAIRFERQVRSGAVQDQSELARRFGVTQPRMTQIMNLALLAPWIQEQVLSLPRVTKGREPVTERTLRRIACEACWERQQKMWDLVVGNAVENAEDNPNRFRA
jgi:DNA-binding transcriptional regulator YdaS (Cro superfamily)